MGAVKELSGNDGDFEEEVRELKNLRFYFSGPKIAG